MGDYKSLAFTWRPKDGVSAHSEEETNIIKWVKAQKYYFLIAEKDENDRHLHGQLFFEKPRKKDSLRKFFKDHLKRFPLKYEGTLLKVALNIKQAVNNEFIENYLKNNKDKICDKSVILAESLPDNYEDFYPEDEEIIKLEEFNKAKDKTLFNLEKEYYEFFENNPMYWTVRSKNSFVWKNYDDYYHVVVFLSDVWYISRSRIVPKRKIDRLELAKTLFCYIQGKKGHCAMDDLRRSILSDKEIEEYNRIYEIKEVTFD